MTGELIGLEWLRSAQFFRDETIISLRINWIRLKKSRESLCSFSPGKFYTFDCLLARSMYLNLNQINIRSGASCERKIFLAIDPFKILGLFYTLTRMIDSSHLLHYQSELLFTWFTRYNLKHSLILTNQ